MKLLKSDIDRCIGRAHTQIERTNRLIDDGHSAFSVIPRSLPRRGITVTLEPYWTATNPFFDRLVTPPSIPSTVVSSRQLENMIARSFESGDISSMLRELYDVNTPSDTQQGTQSDDLQAKNPILDAAWKSNPLWNPVFEDR